MRRDRQALPKRSLRPLPEGVPRKQLDRLTYTVEEAATVIGISRSLAYEAVARGGGRGGTQTNAVVAHGGATNFSNRTRRRMTWSK